jgi:hypothetical protein
MRKSRSGSVDSVPDWAGVMLPAGLMLIMLTFSVWMADGVLVDRHQLMEARAHIEPIVAEVLPPRFESFSIDEDDPGIVDGCHAQLVGGISVQASTSLPVAFEHGGVFDGLELQVARVVDAKWSVLNANVQETGMQDDELRARVSACVKALERAADRPGGPVAHAAEAALSSAAAGPAGSAR